MNDEELVALATEALAEIRAKLPMDLTTGADALVLDDPKVLRAFLREAEQEIVAKTRAS